MSLLRKTTQNPLPVCKPETGKNQYDIYPTHDLGPDKIFCDYTSLARRLAGQKQVVVDGYVGVRFDLFRQELNRALTQLGIRPVWWSVDAALRPQEEIERLVAPYLGGDDPIFGFRTPLRLEEFFDGEKLRAIAPDPEAEMNILIGTGAALAGWQGELVYIDIPKNEIQFRSRAGSIANLGATQPEPPKKMYKRFYFVDWGRTEPPQEGAAAPHRHHRRRAARRGDHLGRGRRPAPRPGAPRRKRIPRPAVVRTRGVGRPMDPRTHRRTAPRRAQLRMVVRADRTGKRADLRQRRQDARSVVRHGDVPGRRTGRRQRVLRRIRRRIPDPHGLPRQLRRRQPFDPVPPAAGIYPQEFRRGTDSGGDLLYPRHGTRVGRIPRVQRGYRPCEVRTGADRKLRKRHGTRRAALHQRRTVGAARPVPHTAGHAPQLGTQQPRAGDQHHALHLHIQDVRTGWRSTSTGNRAR